MTFNKCFVAATAVAITLATSASAATLLGEDVTGELYFGSGTTNYFDPIFGGVDPTALNSAGSTVAISDSDVEFGYMDGANIDMANFGAAGVTITDDVLSSASNWTMVFTSSAFLGATLTELADNFTNGGVTGLLSGDMLTFTWDGTNTTDGFLTANYSIEMSAVPVPASLPLLGGALLAGGAFARRKKRKQNKS